MTTEPRQLIVNADDFGQSDPINRGVLAAHAGGIVTSASLMVRWPDAAAAVEASRAHPRLGLGLHVDLGEWSFVAGSWSPLYEVVPLDDTDAVAVEIDRQLDAFRELTGREPTHLDSHQHVHRREPVRTALLERARRLNLPLRGCTPGISYRGDFYGQTSTGATRPDAVSAAALIRLVETLPAGVTELGCHPAEPGELDTMYAAERVLELRALCDERVRAALDAAGVTLRSFQERGLPA